MDDQRTRWNDRYARGEHASESPSNLLLGAVEGIAPGRALDLACGAGRNAIALAARGWSVRALDSSSEGLALARRRAAASGVEVDFVLTDLETEELDLGENSCDLAMVFFFLHRPLFAAIQRSVRPGGLFVGAIHTTSDVGEAPHRFLLEPGELRAIFGDWEVLESREGVDAGEEHHHPTAELIARRPVGLMPMA